MEDSAITENMSIEGASSLSHISFCLLGTEEVECRVIFSLSLFGIKTKHVSFLTDASSEDLPLSERPSVVISFAREGDTLWNIAKRYNVPMADLLSANDMTDDITVTDGMQFLIPR